jgi:hypothetical protein
VLVYAYALGFVLADAHWLRLRSTTRVAIPSPPADHGRAATACIGEAPAPVTPSEMDNRTRNGARLSSR